MLGLPITMQKYHSLEQRVQVLS